MKILQKLFTLSLLSSLFFACSAPSADLPVEEEELSQEETLSPDEIIRIGNGREGFRFTNKRGDTLFDGRAFAMASEFKFGYSAVAEKKDGKRLYGVINYKGETVIPIEHSDGFITPPQKSGYFIISKNGKFGLIDSTATMIIPMEYKGVLGGLEHGQVQVKNNDEKWGSVTASGETFIPFEYEKFYSWSDDCLLAERSKNQFQFLDPKGKPIHEGFFEKAVSFKQGIALAQKDGKIGFINTDGEVVIDFQYEDYKTIVDAEFDPKQRVYKRSILTKGYTILDKYGNRSKIKNSRFILEEGYILLKKDGKWGYINKTGETVIPFEFDDLSIAQKGADHIGITKDGQQGVYFIKEQKLKMRE